MQKGGLARPFQRPGGQAGAERPLRWLHVPNLREDCCPCLHHPGLRKSCPEINLTSVFLLRCFGLAKKPTELNLNASLSFGLEETCGIKKKPG